jgi:hypothetical protein
VSEPNKRPRGGQPRNLNAAKHLFYSRHFKSGELVDLDAMLAQGLESEISLMRVLVRRVMEAAGEVDSVDHLLYLLSALGMASTRLGGLLKTQKLLGSDQQSEVEAAINEALSEAVKILATRTAKK